MEKYEAIILGAQAQYLLWRWSKEGMISATTYASDDDLEDSITTFEAE